MHPSVFINKNELSKDAAPDTGDEEPDIAFNLKDWIVLANALTAVDEQ